MRGIFGAGGGGVPLSLLTRQNFGRDGGLHYPTKKGTLLIKPKSAETLHKFRRGYSHSPARKRCRLDKSARGSRSKQGPNYKWAIIDTAKLQQSYRGSKATPQHFSTLVSLFTFLSLGTSTFPIDVLSNFLYTHNFDHYILIGSFFFNSSSSLIYIKDESLRSESSESSWLSINPLYELSELLFICFVFRQICIADIAVPFLEGDYYYVYSYAPSFCEHLQHTVPETYRYPN